MSNWCTPIWLSEPPGALSEYQRQSCGVMRRPRSLEKLASIWLTFPSLPRIDRGADGAHAGEQARAVADHDAHAMRLFERGNGERVRHRVGDRLLDIDVLAGGRGAARKFEMHLVRQRQHDRGDGLVGEHGVDVARGNAGVA